MFFPLILFGIPVLILWSLGIYALVLLIKAMKIYIKKNSLCTTPHNFYKLYFNNNIKTYPIFMI